MKWKKIATSKRVPWRMRGRHVDGFSFHLPPWTDCIIIIIIIKMHAIYSGPVKLRATRLVNGRRWHTLYTNPPPSRANDDRFASAIDVFLCFFFSFSLFSYFFPHRFPTTHHYRWTPFSRRIIRLVKRSAVYNIEYSPESVQ